MCCAVYASTVNDEVKITASKLEVAIRFLNGIK